MPRLRVGVMGGSFDPIHYGHLVAASEVAHRFDLDHVVFCPTGQAWHKETSDRAPAELRYLMTVVATAADPRFLVSRVDIDRDGPTYTVDTLRDLRAQFPDAELVLLLGSDALAGLPGWRDPQGILALARVAAFAHPGDPLERPALDGDITLLPIEPLDITATGVRAAIAAGQPIDVLVPPAVVRLIAERGLYRAHA